MIREVCLEWLRPDEIDAKRARCPVVYLLIGPLEWRGPHHPADTNERLSITILKELKSLS